MFQLKTIVVVVAVLALCIIVAEARPRKAHGSGISRKVGGGKQTDRPLKYGVKFCKAPVNANITIDNQPSDKMFIVVNTTCTKLLDDFLAQYESTLEDTAEGASLNLKIVVDKFMPPCATACKLAGSIDCADPVDAGDEEKA